jgi:hypothetical protein
MSQGNHLNLDLGSARVLYLDRTVYGSISVDTRKDDGSRELMQRACLEQGVVKKFLYSGKEMQLLTPKKDELNLWTVVLENSNGESYWRLDTILAAQPLKATEPSPLAQAVHEAVKEGDYLPVDGE